jgi:hypothetical protein
MSCPSLTAWSDLPSKTPAATEEGSFPIALLFSPADIQIFLSWLCVPNTISAFHLKCDRPVRSNICGKCVLREHRKK